MGNFDCQIPLWTTAGGEEGGPPAGSPDFAGVHLIDGYSKTVNLQRSPTVGTLVLAAADGKIAQNDPATYSAGSGGTLTVTSELDWTAGTLNSGSLPGVVALAATATGLAAPANGSTVNLGSTVKLLGNSTTQTGSTLEVQDGEIQLTRNQVGFEVMSFAALGFALGAPVPDAIREKEAEFELTGNETTNNEPKHKITVDAGARMTVFKRPNSRGMPTFTLKGTRPTLRNSGEVEIKDGTNVVFTPTKNALNQDATGLGGGLIQENGVSGPIPATTTIWAGGKITCGRQTTVQIRQGKLNLADHPDTDQRDEVQPEITIASPDTNETTTLSIHADAELWHDTNSGGMLHLVVNGNFLCAGRVSMVVSHVALKNDSMAVSGTVNFTEDSHLDVWWYDETGNSLTVGAWTLITSQSTAPGIDPITVTGDLRKIDDPAHNIALVKDFNPAKSVFKAKIN